MNDTVKDVLLGSGLEVGNYIDFIESHEGSGSSVHHIVLRSFKKHPDQIHIPISFDIYSGDNISHLSIEDHYEAHTILAYDNFDKEELWWLGGAVNYIHDRFRLPSDSRQEKIIHKVKVEAGRLRGYATQRSRREKGVSVFNMTHEQYVEHGKKFGIKGQQAIKERGLNIYDPSGYMHKRSMESKKANGFQCFRKSARHRWLVIVKCKECGRVFHKCNIKICSNCKGSDIEVLIDLFKDPKYIMETLNNMSSTDLEKLRILLEDDVEKESTVPVEYLRSYGDETGLISPPRLEWVYKYIQHVQNIRDPYADDDYCAPLPEPGEMQYWKNFFIEEVLENEPEEVRRRYIG